jgi:hypothetical protein
MAKAKTSKKPAPAKPPVMKGKMPMKGKGCK